MHPQSKLPPILSLIGLTISLGVFLFVAYISWVFAEETYWRLTAIERADTPAIPDHGSPSFSWPNAWFTFKQYSYTAVPLLLCILYIGRLITLMIHRLRGRPRSHRLITKSFYMLAGAFITTYFAMFVLNVPFDSWQNLLIKTLSCIIIFTVLHVSWSLPLAARSSASPKAADAN